MFMVRVGGVPAAITLRDVSLDGASGLMCEPLAEGTRLTLEFDRLNHIEAEVRWVRRMTIGLKFLVPLQPALLNGLYTKYGLRSR